MEKKIYTAIVSSFILLMVFGFNLLDTKPTKVYDAPSSVAPGNTLDQNNSASNDKTYNEHGSIIYNSDNSLAFLQEGFESATFPPPGWSIEFTGTNYWTRNGASGYGIGTGSAKFDFYSANTGVIQSLVTPTLMTTVAGDSLKFDHAYATYINEVDSLEIQTSADGGTSYTTLVQLPGGTVVGTGMVTAPPQTAVFTPTAGQWATKKYGLPVGTNKVKFRCRSAFGNNLYLDNISAGTPSPNDVGTFSIDISNPITSGSQFPKATVKNYGSATQSFPVTMTISGGYSNQQTVNSLAPGATQQVTFANWNPVPGSYLVTVYTQLPGDVNTSNDTLRTTISVVQNLATCGWTSRTPLPVSRATTANAFWRAGSPPNDTGFLYVIGGSNSTFTGFTQKNTRYNTRTNTWQDMDSIPQGRYHAQAVTARNKIFVMGGYNPNFVASNRNDIYNPISNTWSSGVGIPTAVGDFAIGVYNDSLIYLIAGYSGVDQNIVQIYNVVLDTWSTGTSKPGAPVAGLRGSIYKNKIVVAGGYNQTQATSVDSAYVGTIDPTNPTLITWSQNIKYPGGKIARLAAGVPYNSNSNFPYVYFTGGDSTSTGSTASARTWGYNVNTNVWGLAPLKPTKSNNINNFVGVITNDSLFMVNAGGWNGSATTTVNEWLCLGSSLSSTLTLSINFEACNITDTITVELRSTVSPYAVVESQTGLGGLGIPRTFNFASAVNGTSYYIVVKHRNSIETWSKPGGEVFTGGALSYDFTTSMSQAYGNNLVLVGSMYSIYTGDIDQNNVVNLTDIIAINNDAASFATGYRVTDLNCDNVTNLTDVLFAYNNAAKFIMTQRP